MYIDYDNISLDYARNIQMCLNSSIEIKLVKMVYNKQLMYEDIRRFLRSQFRMFTSDGVEIMREDLNFIKNGILLHVTEGQEFNQLNSFQIYEIIKELGEGGFGKVKLGRHRITRDLVAIKFIDTSKIGNAQDIEIVFREAELMKSLKHKNIVEIYNCYTLPSMQVVIIMEYLQGRELTHYLQDRGRLTEDEARVFMVQIAEAIIYCHNKKLVHRDLKLENILLQSRTQKIIKLVDFGIAGMMNKLNVDKIEVGSLSYMAPEVLSGQMKRLGTEVDVWAIGVIMFYLVCGQLPFTCQSSQETTKQIKSMQYEFSPDLTISAEFKNLISLIFQQQSKRIIMIEFMKHPWMHPKYYGMTTSMISSNIRRKTILQPPKVSFRQQDLQQSRISFSIRKDRMSILNNIAFEKHRMSNSVNSQPYELETKPFQMSNLKEMVSIDEKIFKQKDSSSVSHQSLNSSIGDGRSKSLQPQNRSQKSKLITKDYSLVVDQFKSQMKPFRTDIKQFLSSVNNIRNTIIPPKKHKKINSDKFLSQSSVEPKNRLNAGPLKLRLKLLNKWLGKQGSLGNNNNQSYMPIQPQNTINQSRVREQQFSKIRSQTLMHDSSQIIIDQKIYKTNNKSKILNKRLGRLSNSAQSNYPQARSIEWHDFALITPWQERAKAKNSENNYKLQVNFLERKKKMSTMISKEFYSNVLKQFIYDDKNF